LKNYVTTFLNAWDPGIVCLGVDNDDLKEYSFCTYSQLKYEKKTRDTFSIEDYEVFQIIRKIWFNLNYDKFFIFKYWLCLLYVNIRYNKNHV
jgi:hypothetical protein